MKLFTSSLLAFVILVSLLHLACSVSEEKQAAADYPQLAAATQASERIQTRIDPIAVDVQHVASGVQTVATQASGFGLPGASTIALIAGVIGTIAGVYNERRTGTLPMKSAFAQVVQSVEAAFPTKSAEQKAALAAVQDQATQTLVAQAKAG